MQDIISMSREKTAKWIPNAIQINTNSEKVKFREQMFYIPIFYYIWRDVRCVILFYIYIYMLWFSTVVLQLIFSKGEKLPWHVSALAECSDGEGDFFLFNIFLFKHYWCSNMFPLDRLFNYSLHILPVWLYNTVHLYSTSWNMIWNSYVITGMSEANSIFSRT